LIITSCSTEEGKVSADNNCFVGEGCDSENFDPNADPNVDSLSSC
jgi:hypothetical protein